MDAAFGELLAVLKREGLYDETMIVLTSDHGEEFGERGKVGWHSHTLFDELLHVPLIIKFPESRFAGAVIDRQVRSIDIAPTILDVLGVPIPKEFEGVSLLTEDEARDAARFAISQLDTKPEGPQLHSVRTEEWKLVGERLFHLAHDAGEEFDVGTSYPEISKRLSDEWFRVSDGKRPVHVGELEIEAETRARLRALGYGE
jgi:arylsulfatase A-like enzyme